MTAHFVHLRELPPQAARFCLGVERFCRTELAWGCAGQSVLAAYSGGADSKALLLALHYLSSRLGITLHAATLNHGLRREAAREVAEAEAFCAALNFPFHTAAADVASRAVEKGIGLEEAGREARFEFFASVRQRTGCAWVAVGHQLNDLAEDSLMRMTRGAGWPALAGMAGIDPARRIVRPLLLNPRCEIEAFLRSLGHTWHEDAMNKDDAFFRNRVRKHLLPLFLRENPAFLDAVAERWRMARADERFFAERLDSLPAKTGHDGIFLSHDALSQAASSIRVRKYRSLLAELGPGQVTAKLLRALDAVWLRNEGGKTVQFPGGKTALVKHGGILFRGKNSG